MEYLLTQEELDELKAPAKEDCSEHKKIAMAVINCKEVMIINSPDFEVGALIHVVLRAEDLPGYVVKHLEQKVRATR